MLFFPIPWQLNQHALPPYQTGLLEHAFAIICRRNICTKSHSCVNSTVSTRKIWLNLSLLLFYFIYFYPAFSLHQLKPCLKESATAHLRSLKLKQKLGLSQGAAAAIEFEHLSTRAQFALAVLCDKSIKFLEDKLTSAQSRL